MSSYDHEMHRRIIDVLESLANHSDSIEVHRNLFKLIRWFENKDRYDEIFNEELNRLISSKSVVTEKKKWWPFRRKK